MTKDVASWTAHQLLAASARHVELPPRFNPRPPGVIRDGGATQAVLAWLEARPRRWWTSGQIVAQVGRSRVAVSWALLYLRQLELVDVMPDSGRNARYLVYRHRGSERR